MPKMVTNFINVAFSQTMQFEIAVICQLRGLGGKPLLLNVL